MIVENILVMERRVLRKVELYSRTGRDGDMGVDNFLNGW